MASVIKTERLLTIHLTEWYITISSDEGKYKYNEEFLTNERILHWKYYSFLCFTYTFKVRQLAV